MTTTLRDWLLLLRPQQWVKNGFVLAPLLFSGRMLQVDAIRLALEACASFCLVASAVYVFNDVIDRERDRAHPVKRLRPVASGRISAGAALPVALALGVVGLGLGWLVHPTVGAILGSYLGLNLLYTLRLKQVVLLDVFSIATFFVLRLLAGAEAIQVVPSIWLILCGGLLALYLGFAKRRHELMLLGGASASHRGVLAEYSPQFLDQMSTVLLSVTLISYVMYTLSPEKLAEVGSYALTYSTGFVLYGVFRYLYLVHQKEQGSPTEALLTDRSLLTAVVLWAGYCALVIYRAV
ncbi:MAG: decaprenyl-phosphate phosphoribosyltransferase [Gemmatimonadetes bacterium]|nr:decaprenyl-phosphate phosphoribosyltransferase [Gemmatimonadota bacterium]